MVLDRKTNFFLGKKMVLDRKTNFSLGKRWFWTGKSWGREKPVLGRKTNFFLGKTKKKHLLRHYAARHQKHGFLGFP